MTRSSINFRWLQKEKDGRLTLQQQHHDRERTIWINVPVVGPDGKPVSKNTNWNGATRGKRTER